MSTTKGYLLNKYRNTLLLLLLILIPFFSRSLGVLTHEAIIDASWDKTILPLLKGKYPSATADELKDAHAYAYGGAVTPDIGYYPFGSKLFTNLVHYVRTGDMVNSLIRNAQNLNEYAFALGFLSHYLADNDGHPLATNRSVPLVYKKIKRRFGDYVTYEQNKIAHVRMEFGFDVLQTAKGNYASPAYHDFIGFKIDTAVLGRAFFETYGLEINNVFSNHLPRTVELFRFIIANIFPLITKSAWASKGSGIKTDKTTTSKNFRYRMRIREYNKDYGTGYRHPGFMPTVLSFFIRVLPKVGPTRALRFKIPTPQAEKYFDQAFDTIMKNYASELNQLKSKITQLTDENFDTGKPTLQCDYMLTDATYSRWLLKLKDDHLINVSTPIKQDLVNFYDPFFAGYHVKYTKKCSVLHTAFLDLKDYHTSQSK